MTGTSFFPLASIAVTVGAPGEAQVDANKRNTGAVGTLPLSGSNLGPGAAHLACASEAANLFASQARSPADRRRSCR